MCQIIVFVITLLWWF